MYRNERALGRRAHRSHARSHSLLRLLVSFVWAYEPHYRIEWAEEQRDWPGGLGLCSLEATGARACTMNGCISYLYVVIFRAYGQS